MKIKDIDVTKPDFFNKLEMYYQNQIIPCKKTREEILDHIDRKFGLTLLEKGDLKARRLESFHDIAQVIDKFNDLLVYEMNLNNASINFYKYHEDHFFKGYPILIFYSREEDFLDSNCGLLQFELKILQGIDTSDIVSRSRRYKDYLNSMYLLEWSMTNLMLCGDTRTGAASRE